MGTKEIYRYGRVLLMPMLRPIPPKDHMLFKLESKLLRNIKLIF